MIPVVQMEVQQLQMSANYRLHEAADYKRGCVITLPDKRVVTLIQRTVAMPDGPSELTYAATTTTSGADRLSGLSVQIKKGADDAVPSMLADIKRMTGWPWDRLAKSLGRTRQAVHGWTLGREITQENLERLAKLRATITYIDRGSAEENRVLLSSTTPDGLIVADLIDDARFDDVRAICGRGTGAREETSIWTRKVEQTRASEIARNGHWVDQLAETEGVEVPFEYITPLREKRRITVQRRG